MTGARARVLVPASLVIASIHPANTQQGVGGTAEISGTIVTTSVPPAPLARVLVTISGSAFKQSQTVITDDQGRFTFRNLPDGSFTLAAARPPYVKTAFGAKRPGRPGTPINLAAGQKVTNVTIPMGRGAAITGRVRNPGGEPAPGVQVVVTPLDTQTDPLGPPALTDDRGIYRIFGLPPGRFNVKASIDGRAATGLTQSSDAEMDAVLARLQSRPGPGARRASGNPAAKPASPGTTTHPVTFGYAPIYFPGTSDPEEAESLVLAEGEERAGVDLDLQLVRSSTIQGRVSSAGAPPPSGTQVTLTRASPRGRASDTVIASTAARLDADGGFRFTGVLPGKYRVVARSTATTPVLPAPSPNPPTASQPVAYRITSVLWALADITVGDDDPAALALALQPGLKLSGRLVFDAHGLTPPETVPLRLTDLTGASMFAGTGRANGPFEIVGVPAGTYNISSTVSEAGWWLKSVVIDGRDALDVPLEFGAAGDVSGAIATFTDQHSELSGTLQTAVNTPAPDYFVVVFAADRSFWRPASRRVRFTRPGTDGHFTLRDLPAGDYFIAALTDMEPSDLADRTFLEGLITAAVPMHLSDGESKTQDLRLAK